MKRNRKQRDRYSSGFTLIEVLVVMIIVGILSAIAAPSFLGFVNNQRINTSQTEIFQAIKVAQSDAKIRKINSRAGRVKLSFIYPNAGSPKFKLDNVRTNSGIDQPLESGVEIVSITESGVVSTTNPYVLEFDAKGFLGNPPIEPDDYPICINLKAANSTRTRWIAIRTILGSVVTGADTPCT